MEGDLETASGRKGPLMMKWREGAAVLNGLDMVRTTSDKKIATTFQGQITVFKY